MEQTLEPGMILCVHRENGRYKQCPKHWFDDPAMAIKLDWVPVQGKKFEDEIPSEVKKKILAEKESADKQKAEPVITEKPTTETKKESEKTKQ